MFTGILAMLWVVLWWAFYHNPDKHPNLSKAELDFIRQDNEAPPVKLPFLTALKTVGKNKTLLRYRYPSLYGRTGVGGDEFLGSAIPVQILWHGPEADRTLRLVAVPRR